ncbi:Zinc finger, RING-type [Dillenia turbinata]|uniref:RING-type E3 ubiquitin transferase n=1 Tax=Dillenia turbinata TaxID=194707 RepID=A0AAN8ZNR2_9MAGN
MEAEKKSGGHLTSAAAFVEGGIQEANENACSICLEAFSDSEPATVTNCKHEYHLQCILEWCQRSSQCPMCWQAISLKDPSSQELLEVVESERNFRLNSSRNAAIFHHPMLGDFDLQQFHLGANDSDFEEHLFQHLAAAAAMGRAHHIAGRESQRTRSSAHGRPQFLVLSAPSNAPAPHVGRESEPAAMTLAGQSSSFPTGGVEQSQLPPVQSLLASGFSGMQASRQGIVVANGSMNQTSGGNQSRPGPSDFQSFSESLKSRLSSASMRYKESISKSTRGLKERWFSRSPSIEDIGSEVRREVNAGIASVSRMMERLESRDHNGANNASVSNSTADSSVAGPVNPNNAEASETALSDNNSPPCATNSMPH